MANKEELIDYVFKPLIKYDINSFETTKNNGTVLYC